MDARLTCAACRQSLPTSSYSKTQRKSKTGARCRECIDKLTPKLDPAGDLEEQRCKKVECRMAIEGDAWADGRQDAQEGGI